MTLSKRSDFIKITQGDKQHKFLSLREACEKMGFSYNFLLGKSFPFNDSGWLFEKLKRVPNTKEEFYQQEKLVRAGEIRLQRIKISTLTDLRHIARIKGISVPRFVTESLPSVIESFYKEFPNQRPVEEN